MPGNGSRGARLGASRGAAAEGEQHGETDRERGQGVEHVEAAGDRDRHPTELGADQAFALELLTKKHVLIAPGSSFNVPYNDHFRLTTLPDAREMAVVFERMEAVLQSMAG